MPSQPLVVLEVISHYIKKSKLFFNLILIFLNFFLNFGQKTDLNLEHMKFSTTFFLCRFFSEIVLFLYESFNREKKKIVQ